MGKPKHTINCVYCGDSAGTSDHVPPKCFFPKPRPSDLITVPCCFSCNHGKEKDEEFFLATLMFSEAGQTQGGKVLWEQKMNRLYFRGRGVSKAIGKRMKRVNLFSPSGIYSGQGYGVEIDYPRLESVVRNIVRGLYFSEFREALGPEVKVECKWLNTKSLFESTRPQIENLRFGSRMWPGLFEYRGDRFPEQPGSSIWAMRFFEYAIFWAITNYPNDTANKAVNAAAFKVGRFQGSGCWESDL